MTKGFEKRQDEDRGQTGKKNIMGIYLMNDAGIGENKCQYEVDIRQQGDDQKQEPISSAVPSTGQFPAEVSETAVRNRPHGSPLWFIFGL
jgi:hypothetical protein